MDGADGMEVDVLKRGKGREKKKEREREREG